MSCESCRCIARARFATCRLWPEPGPPPASTSQRPSRNPRRGAITISSRAISFDTALHAGAGGQHPSKRGLTFLQRLPQRCMTSKQKTLAFFGSHHPSAQIGVLVRKAASSACSDFAVARSPPAPATPIDRCRQTTAGVDDPEPHRRQARLIRSSDAPCARRGSESAQLPVRP